MSCFSRRLKDLRKEKGLSQDELAKYIGITRSSIGNYEQGLREPDRETLESIADFFNVDIDYLLGRKDWITSIDTVNDIHFNYISKVWDLEIDYVKKALQDEELSKRLEAYAKKLVELKEMEDM